MEASATETGWSDSAWRRRVERNGAPRAAQHHSVFNFETELGAVIDDFKGEVEFRGVRFAYPQREAAVLGGVDFIARPGETVALIGQSGSGKSTAVQLVERFYDPTTRSAAKDAAKKDASEDLSSILIDGARDPAAGCVTVDGVDLRDLDPMWLRTQIGIVEQEPTLFSGSVHENIAAGKGGAAATRAHCA